MKILSWTGWSFVFVLPKPSTVVIAAPCKEHILHKRKKYENNLNKQRKKAHLVMHALTGECSTSFLCLFHLDAVTVHAPHAPSPHTDLVPHRPSSPRR